MPDREIDRLRQRVAQLEAEQDRLLDEHRSFVDSLYRARRRDSALLDLNERIGKLEAPREIMKAAAELVGERLGVDRAGYAEIDEQEGLYDIVVCWSGALPPITGALAMEAIGAPTLRLFRAGRTLVVADGRADPASPPVWRDIGARAAISVPLVRDGRFEASLFVHQAAPRTWTQEEIELLQEIAARTWEAVKRARAEAAHARVEAQLRQAQKMEALGHLTGGIAHDLNNQLMAILGNLEILDRRLDQGRVDVRRQAANAMHAVKRAAALTQRLLTFARSHPLEAESVALAPLIDEMRPIIAATVGASIAVEVDLADDLTSVWCDPHQLESALLNLVINARDAMPEGGRLQLAARNLTLDAAAAATLSGGVPGDYVRLSVTDSGVGMPSEVSSQAFDPFFTTKPRGQGAGLGLSILYSFVRQSRGFVELRSEVGAGTEVALLLRRAPTAGVGAPSPKEPEAATAGRGETIMVVEDEDLVRQVIVETLREQGYDCVEVESAQQALGLERSGAAFDLLLTDIGLPGRTDGRELARRIRLNRPRLPVLFISGHDVTTPPGAREAGESPVVYLPKPFEMTRLARKVREVLDAA